MIEQVKLRQLAVMGLLLASILLLSACAASDAGDSQGGAFNANTADRITACKSTDQLISSSQQCLQDDAACYQISSGQWCTGERGASCPAGSSAIPADATCPSGSRCFQISESLHCQI